MEGLAHWLAEVVLPSVMGDQLWEPLLREVIENDICSRGVHLAVFSEPFLSFVMTGKKRVESRFGVKRAAPYHRVAPGDIVLVKRVGGPVVGICLLSHVWFYEIMDGSWDQIRKEFAEALCAQDPLFWAQRSRASYATLMQLQSVKEIPPAAFPKRDRRGWAVLRNTLRPHGFLWA